GRPPEGDRRRLTPADRTHPGHPGLSRPACEGREGLAARPQAAATAGLLAAWNAPRWGHGPGGSPGRDRLLARARTVLDVPRAGVPQGGHRAARPRPRAREGPRERWPAALARRGRRADGERHRAGTRGERPDVPGRPPRAR